MQGREFESLHFFKRKISVGNFLLEEVLSVPASNLTNLAPRQFQLATSIRDIWPICLLEFDSKRLT